MKWTAIEKAYVQYLKGRPDWARNVRPIFTVCLCFLPQLHSIQDCGGVTDEIKCYLIKNEVKLHNDQPNQIERLEIKIQL